MRESTQTKLLHCLMWLLAAIAVVLFLLEAGAWSRTETFKGPFSRHPQFAGVHVLTLGKGLPLRCCVTTGGDSRDYPGRSTTWLRIDGAPVEPGHLPPRSLASEGAGFGHWRNEVVFALPAGVGNSPSVTAAVGYAVHPKHLGPALPTVMALLLALWLYGRRLPRPAAETLCLLPARTMLFVGYAALALAIAYAGGIVVAVVAGEPLPTAAPLRWHWASAGIAGFEHQASFLLLALAASGSLAACVSARWLNPLPRLRALEEAVCRFAGRWGLPLSVMLMVLSASAVWAGIPRPGDFIEASIAGLIPFNDANGYFADAHDVQRLGYWSDFSARRSLAAAFRTVTLIAGGNSYAGMLLVQTLLVATAAFVAAVSVARWLGIWAAIAFFAICHGIIRIYLPTSLTEPLGFFWALLSVPLLIASLRQQSVIFGLAGLALLTLALFTRMGAMFAIPALALWLVWHFASNWPSRFSIAAAALAVLLLPVALNVAMQKTFVERDAQIGSNFAYTLCGLSVGSNWTGCLGRYKDERRAAPDQTTEQFLYRKAVENILDQPQVFAGRLGLGTAVFATRLPEFLVTGVSRAKPPPWFPTALFFLGALFLLVRRLSTEREAGELGLWMLLAAGTLASAGFVYFDDGRRVMLVIYPLAALLLTSGMGGASPRSAPGKMPSVAPAMTLGALAILACIAVPLWARLAAPTDSGSAARPEAGVNLIAGGHRLTGFLVIPDGNPLPAVPAFHVSAFRRIALLGNIEDFDPLVTPPARPLPFGLVTGPRLEPGVTSGRRYIVPAEVLLRQDVEGWRLHLAPQTPKSKTYWTEVLRAEPLPSGE